MRSEHPAAVEKFPTLRQSLLSDFDACGLSAKFNLAYAEGWDGHPQARGRLFHRFAAKALEEMHRQGEITIEVDVALAILHEVLRQADVPPEEMANIPMAQVNDLYWIVKKWAYENVFDIEHLVDVEHRLEAKVRYPDPAGGFIERRLTGQLDALLIQGEQAEEAVVIDWKDTWALPGPTDVSFEGYFQQRFYGWLVMRSYPSVEKVTLREFYVRYSEPREAVVWREGIEDIEAELTAMAERFDRAWNEDAWPPSPGKHCSYCTRPSACPIPAFARGEGAITTAEEAERVGARLVVAKATYDQAIKSLKAWGSVHGDTPIKAAKGRRVWGYRQSERTERPKREDLEAALREAGTEIDVDSLYPTKTSTRFGQHTPPNPEEADAEMQAQLEESLKALAEKSE